jgi:hypothetical protein
MFLNKEDRAAEMLGSEESALYSLACCLHWRAEIMRVPWVQSQQTTMLAPAQPERHNLD